MDREPTKAEHHLALIFEAVCIPEDDAQQIQNGIDNGASFFAGRIAAALFRIKYDNYVGDA